MAGVGGEVGVAVGSGWTVGVAFGAGWAVGVIVGIGADVTGAAGIGVGVGTAVGASFGTSVAVSVEATDGVGSTSNVCCVGAGRSSTALSSGVVEQAAEIIAINRSPGTIICERITI